jgi:hypothetical protein
MDPLEEVSNTSSPEKPITFRNVWKRPYCCWWMMTVGFIVILTKMRMPREGRLLRLLEPQKKQPVLVQIFLESLCIDSQRYMQQQILPTWQALHATPQIMHLQVIVFGNAHYESTSNRLLCQHGVAECDANRYDLCVQSIERNDIHRYLPYFACLFDGRLPMGYRNTTYSPAIFASCARETAIPWSSLQDCYYNTTRIEELEYEASVATSKSNHTYVPWVTLNGKHLPHEDETNLLYEIWSVYQNNSRMTIL